MKPNDYNYRIINKNGTFYVLIDKKSSNINVLQIKKMLESIVKKYQLPYNTDNVKLYVSGQLLTGAAEYEIKTLFFGSEVDGNIDNEQPIYRLCGDKHSDNQMLHVYFKGSSLSICNYSVNEESLGIKLDFKSEEADLIAKAEQYAKEQQEKQSSQSSSAQMLTPLLKGDKVTCMHGGEVMLVSQDGEPFCNDSDSFILGNDLLQASITGCNNNILGVPRPCTKIVLVPPSALSITKFNNQGVVIQEHLQTIMTDNMVGLMLKQAVEPNLWEVLSHQPSTNKGEAEGVLSELIPGIFYLKYNNISSGKVCIINTTFENISNASYANTFSLDDLSLDNPLDIEFDKPEESDSSIDSTILEEFKSLKSNTDDYIYKALTVIVDNNINEYILVIPKAKNSLLKKLPKEYRDYGYGKITNLSYIKKRAISSSNGNEYNIGFANISTIFLRFSAGAKKVLLHIDSTSSLVNKSEAQNQNQTQSNQKTQILCNYMSSEDFSNQYAYKFNSYYLYYNSGYDKTQYKYMFSYPFIEHKPCNDNEKIEFGMDIDVINKKFITNTNDNDDYEYNNEESRQKIAEVFCDIISSDNINEFVDECINSYDKFLEILEDKQNNSQNNSQLSDNSSSDYYGGFNLDKLKEIFKLVKDSRNQMYQSKEKYRKELADASENLLRNLIIRKIFELIKDNIIPFAKSSKGTAVSNLRHIMRFFSKIPYLGIIFIIIDIAMTIKDIIESAQKAPKLMEEFYNVLSFYAHLDAELAVALSSNSVNHEVFYKKKNNNGTYSIALYNSRQVNTRLLGILHNNLQTFCNYIRVTVDEDLYNQDTFFIPQGNICNSVYLDKFAQLSIYNDSEDLKVSSNFHHVKDLIMKANTFTMIESPNYSSIFISELIKQGFYSPLGEKINKNVVIITEGIEKHDLVYKSQNYVFSELLTDKEIPHIYSFRLMKEYSISEIENYIIKQVIEIFNDLSNTFKGLDSSRVESKVNDAVEYRKMQEYADAFAETYKEIFSIKTKRSILESFTDAFFIEEKGYLWYFYIMRNLQGLYYINMDILDYMQAVCYKFSQDMNKLYKEKGSYMDILEKYKKYNFEKYPILNTVSRNIDKLHSLIEMMYRILAYFNMEILEDELKDNIDRTISDLHKEIDNFFQLSTLKPSETTLLLKYICSDENLYNICKLTVSAEYSYEYSVKKAELRSAIDSYAVNSGGMKDYKSIKLLLSVSDLYKLFNKVSSCINKYTSENINDNHKQLFVLTHSVYTINQNFFKKLFYKGIPEHFKNILPVTKASIEFAADKIEYYDLLLEIIFVNLLSYIDKNYQQNSNSNSLPESDKYLCSYIFTQALNYISFGGNISIEEQIECAKIMRIAHILLSDDLYDYVKQLDYKQLEYRETNIVETALIEANPIPSDADGYIKKIGEFMKNGIDNGIDSSTDNSNLPAGVKNAMNDLSLILKYATGEYSLSGMVSDIVSDDSGINNRNRITGLMTSFRTENLTSVLKEAVKASSKNILSAKNIDDFLTENIVQTYIDFVYELIMERFFPIIDLEEFEAKTNAIKYAYTSKRVDSKGAVYDTSRDMIALPVTITQNYLMSDFKAALIGGAAFDNDCFVRGTSAGIFIQDNDKISQNFVYKLCDYIYNVPLDTIDDKNALYVEAYKKIISYLYNIDSSVTKIKELYNNIGTSLLSDYGVVILSLDRTNNTENNEHYNINAQDEKYIQVSYIDDFAIQLKRFGEYNHKYFYSHQELISEGNGSISDVDWSNQNKENINKQPVLLGSLVYDKEWIDNKMEE